jgi:hypothetical protein
VPGSLWERADTTDALRSRDVRRLFHLLRQYAGASQTRLGIACGLTQGKVSEIMSGAHRVTTLDVFERIADGLRMPPQARLAMGLAPSAPDLGSAPAIPPWDGRTVELLGGTSGAPIVMGPLDRSDKEDPVQRRTFARLAGASLVGPLLSNMADNAGRLRAAEKLAATLVTPDTVTAGDHDDLSALTSVVAAAKRSYQACQYTEVMSELPALLPALEAACGNLDGDDKLRAYALSADAYHVAASAC